MSVEIHRDDQGNYAGVSSVDTGKPMPEGAALVRGGDGWYALPPMVEPVSDNPFENGPPEDDRLLMLETDHAAWTAMLDRYSAEMAGIPSLRHEAMVKEDFKALHRADDRYVELKALIANASVAQARAALALAHARKAIAKQARDTRRNYNSDIDLSLAGTAVVEARAALAAALRAIGG